MSAVFNKEYRLATGKIRFWMGLFIVIVIAGAVSCSGSREQPERMERTITDEEAEQLNHNVLDEVSPDLAEGLGISLWASKELMSDPVALDVDDRGNVLVTITERRRNAELDIRAHRDWMIESVMMETVEDRREFIHREMAPERSEYNSDWLPDHNGDGLHDWRDLTVNRESIFILRDETGNGFANRSGRFIYDFHEEVTDVAGAVLRHQDDVFLGVSPDMWRIRDTNGDGYGDEKESISHGFGTNIGFSGHGMSGLTVGPAGRIYWSIGDVGMSATDREGKTWHHPRQGVIVRSDPDGSNFEVFAHGLRNTHEFVFDKYGNLISVDNDGDHAGESERLVYLVDGSDSGWRLNWQFGKYDDPKNNDYKVLMDERYYSPRFEDQAAHLLPPLASYRSGPAGMVYNPGTALNEEWDDHFFIAEFVGSPSRSGINAFTLRAKGAAFELESDKEVMRGILATGLDVGPDGALYFADWLDGWTLKQAGRIWKLDSAEGPGKELRVETKQLLGEDFGELSANRLLELLGHRDMRVRQKAQFELAGRDDRETLERAIEQTGIQLARVHGIWGLAQIGRTSAEAVKPLLNYLTDSDNEIRAQAAKMLGDVRYEPAAEPLISLLQDDHPRVRFFAVEALGRLSWRPALGPILDMLEENNDEDVYLRHGGAIALERIGDEEALGELATHSSRAVRIAAVVALKRLDSPQVIPFLRDEDEFIVTNAARAINDDTLIGEGLDELSGMLEQGRFLNEPLLRRAINAALYHGTSADARRLAAFAVRPDVSDELKAEALRTLAVWEESSVLDRVTGDPRGAVENNPEHARQAGETVITTIFEQEGSDVKLAALEMISNLGIKSATENISRLVRHDPSAGVRIGATDALVEMGYEEIETIVYTALEDEVREVRMNALRHIPNLGLPDERITALIEPVLAAGSVPEKQTALTTLAGIDHPSAVEMLSEQFDLLLNGELAPEIELELIRAGEASGSEELAGKVREYRTQQSGESSVDRYREALYGGDAAEGRNIFYRSAAAQCIRCHVVEGQGSDVGPDLTGIADRLSREKILEAMVDPDAEIAPGYGSVTVTLENGDQFRGLLAGETDTQLTVRSGEEEWVLDKKEIRERTNSPSGMPAMGDLLSREELRDLVEFLMTLE